MKETVFDVLIYLFENYLDDDAALIPDTEIIKSELLEAGFQQPEINKAFDWLESLTEQKKIKSTVRPAFRVFSKEESARLDTSCRDLLLYLEQAEILTPANRELVIDRAMALQDEEISLENLKWLILMVLFSQPDEEIAFARMEDLVYDNVPTYLH